MPCCDRKVLVNARSKGPRILLPQQVMQEDPHHIQPKLRRPAKFEVNALWTERARLPHLQLVAGSSGDVVAATSQDKPAYQLLAFSCDQRGSEAGKSSADSEREGIAPQVFMPFGELCCEDSPANTLSFAALA